MYGTSLGHVHYLASAASTISRICTSTPSKDVWIHHLVMSLQAKPFRHRCPLANTIMATAQHATMNPAFPRSPEQQQSHRHSSTLQRKHPRGTNSHLHTQSRPHPSGTVSDNILLKLLSMHLRQKLPRPMAQATLLAWPYSVPVSEEVWHHSLSLHLRQRLQCPVPKVPRSRLHL